MCLEVAMKFNILHEDTYYIDALKRYYNKHYKREVELIFNDDDLLNYTVITTQSKLDSMGLENALILSDRNQIMTKEIKMYQSGQEFMTFLNAIREEDFIGDLPFRSFGFMNALSASGSTILSLNLAQELSSRGKTLWYSIEDTLCTMFYLDRKSGVSLSDILFYMKQDQDILKSRLLEWHLEGLYWFDQSDLLDDMHLLTIEDLKQLLILLKEVGFSNIVIDFGSNVEWFNKITIDYKSIVLLYNYNHFYRLSYKLQGLNLDDYTFFINKRKHDTYLNESHLRIINTYHYIEYDYDLTEDRRWQSKLIQSKLLKALKLS